MPRRMTIYVDNPSRLIYVPRSNRCSPRTDIKIIRLATCRNLDAATNLKREETFLEVPRAAQGPVSRLAASQ
jgi:hypothetical protein